MLSGEARLKAYAFAAHVLKDNFERYPYDARTAVYLSHVLDTAPPEAVSEEALLRDVLADAIELSPKRSQPHYILSNISLKKGDATTILAEREQHYREAIAVLEAYAVRVPTFAEPRFIIAALYQIVGEEALAAEWAAEGSLFYNGNTEVARRAVRYYLAAEDWENGVLFLREVVGSEPDNYELQYDLAKVEFLSGNVETAKQIVEQLRMLAPGLVETDPAFLGALEAVE
jgi:hypothetical protein